MVEMKWTVFHVQYEYDLLPLFPTYATKEPVAPLPFTASTVVIMSNPTAVTIEAMVPAP